MHQTKIFQSGHSQAVRIPKDFRFNCSELTITKVGNGILLQPTQKSWMDLYAAMTPIADFMDERDEVIAQEKEGF
jgi:antitoxin VapB